MTRPTDAPSPSWTIDPDRRLVHIEVSGRLTRSAIARTAVAVLNDPGFNLGLPVVLDLRRATPFKRTARTTSDESSRARPGQLVFGRIAVVATDRTMRALVYRYKRAIGSYGMHVRVFRTLTLAQRWCARSPHPSADSVDERWRRHHGVRVAHANLLRALEACIDATASGGGLSISDANAHAVHDRLRLFTHACRALAEPETSVQRLLTLLLVQASGASAPLHPAFVSAMRQWTSEAYSEAPHFTSHSTP